MDGITQPPPPVNEPVRQYEPGSPEREELTQALATLGAEQPELPSVIAGEPVPGYGAERLVVQPHAHAEVIGSLREPRKADVSAAIEATAVAAPDWRALPFDERAAIFLKAADLLAGPWRARLNAATMLGQSKTSHQAEIDSACELIDFWRFNVHFARELLSEQPPANAPGVWNRSDHRPLEGFVYAITPFNFTAIAGNLPTAPALLGNTVLWKPAPTQQRAASLIMDLLIEAGLPPGVINMLTGDGQVVSQVALQHPDLAGIHFTGSTAVFHHLWAQVGQRLPHYRCYPRIVGETGGKDFVLAHPSADPQVVLTALVRGAFEFQGQKCSAASRAYLPASLWEQLREQLASTVDALPVGDVRDFGTFVGAVIDDRAFGRHATVLAAAAQDPEVDVIAGGTCDDEVGYFVRPTVLAISNPEHEAFRTEYFGPILAVYVYPDEEFEQVMTQLDGASPYALTGAIIARDRAAIARASERLRFTAGNFYINDKPTGAVVGQQPFGGGRASGTNDKAGAVLNLHRWVSQRTIKETFDPPTDWRYPYLG